MVNDAGGHAPEAEAPSPSGLVALDTSPQPEPPADPLARRANLVSGAVAALGVVVYVALAVETGLPTRDALLGIAAPLLTQVLPGAVMWRCLRPRAGWLLEDVAAGFAIGSAVAVPVQVVAGLSHQRWLALALPLLVMVLLLGHPTTRRRCLDARWVALPWWFAPAVVGTSLVAIPQFLDYAGANRLSYTRPTVPHVDTYLHQALASELLNRGPVAWPTVAGEDLGYHWFTHAWLAQVTATSGVELDAVLTRIMPALMPMAVVLAVAVAGLRLSGKAWVGAVAAALTMAGGRFNPFGIAEWPAPLTPLSPTLALGAPTLLLLVTVLALRWRAQTLWGAWVLVPLLAVVCAGTKGSTAPLVVAGLALAVVAMSCWNRTMVRPVFVDLLVVGGGLVFAVIVVFHGSSAGLELGVTKAADQSQLFDTLLSLPTQDLVVLATVLALVGGLSRAALAFVLPFHRDTRVDPLTWTLIGSSVAGAAAIALFSHPGRSQGYFYLTAIPLAALGSALGLERMLRGHDRRVLAVVAVLAAGGGVATFVAPVLVTGPLGPGADLQAWVMGRVALACLAVVTVLAGLAAAVLLRRRPEHLDGRARSGRRGLLVVVLAALCGTLLATGASGAVVALVQGPPPAPPEVRPENVTLTSWGAVSQGEIDTARFIRDHSGVDDLVMTNRHCTVPREPFGGCDSRRWIVTAFSERQALVEGWTATPEATRRAPHGRDSVTVDYWKPDVLRLNDRFTRTPDAADQRALWDLGVRWVYLENTMPHAESLAPYAVERFRTEDASAWQLSAPTAP